MALLPPASYRFGRAEIMPVERLLRVDGRPAAVGARAFDVLLALVERGDRLVTRDELLDIVWPDTDVEPNNLAVQIGSLRKVLGPDVIATVPGRGYRVSVAVDNLRQPVAVSTPIPPGARKLKTNLPDVLAPLIGRDDELALLSALVDTHRLVTVTGAGGIGKTRLAQRLLHDRRAEYAQGVCWVDLAPVADAAALPGVIAVAMGIALGGVDAMAALRAALAPMAMLIALDNAEHLMADVARLVAALHAGAPALHIVVTSQAALHVQGENVYRLGALAVPSDSLPAAQALRFGAVALFVLRARAADARFVFDDGNASAVIELCGRLDGLALAIELAAARVPVLGVRRIIQSLDQRLQLLVGLDRSAPARQHTLRGALEWSHGLLDAHERTVFRRLAVIAGSASLELVQRVAADAEGPLDRWAVVDALGGLVERSMVAVDDEAADRERPRYRLLDSPRAYAEERLRDSGEADRLRERHARAVARELDAGWSERMTGRMGIAAWQARYEPDADNARAALAWALAQGELDLALAIAPLMLGLLPYALAAERTAAARCVESLLARTPAGAASLRAWTSLITYWTGGQAARIKAEAGPAIALARSLGDRLALYVLLSCLVKAEVESGDVQSAADALAEMDSLEDPSWPPAVAWHGAEARSTFATIGGDPAARLPLIRLELALARLAGGNVEWVLGNLVDAELAAGEVQAAVASGRALLDSLQGTRNDIALVYARVNFAAALLAQGSVAEARTVAEAGWPHALQLQHAVSWWADYLSLLAASEGRARAAARLAGYAEACYARNGNPRWPNEKQAAERAVALARSALGTTEVDRLMNEGRRLNDAQIAGIAFHGDAGE